MDAALAYKPGRPKHSSRPQHTLAERRARPGEVGSAVGMPRYVQRASAPVPVQRDEPSTLPSIPRYQLTPPSLLQQPQTPGLLQRPQTPGLLQQPYQLGLGTDVAAWLEQVLQPARIRSSLTGQLSLDPSGAGSSAGPTAGPSSAPTTRPEGPEPAPEAMVPKTPDTVGSPDIAPTPPLVPNVPPSPGLGIFLGMAMAHPAFNQAVTDLKHQGIGAWRSLGAGQKAALITSTAIVGVGSFSVMMSDPRYRSQILGMLDGAFNGQVVGIPFTPISVEMNFKGSNMMFGLHLDLGAVLPSRLGFGPASPVGPYPMLQPMPPLQREMADDVTPAPPDLGQRIQTATGGQPLDATTQRRLEHRLGVALPDVQLHTDAEADQLSRAVGARAFTSGAHVFFRADAHPDTAADGLRLLAHETLHAAQQTAGPVAGTPAPGGVALSDPGDRFERAASTAAEQRVPASAAPG